MSRFVAPIAEQIWDKKYRFKDAAGIPIDQTVEDTWRRIAKALAKAEKVAERPRYEALFYDALSDFRFIPAGRIVAGAGTSRNVTLFNCFVMGTIPDSMSGIFDMLKEAALTMQQGGGIGYDFSPIRPSGSLVEGVAADASGPLTFMDVWDAMCRTVMSAGSRRGAMMATMRCDHPDIRKFITAKHDSAKLRMFNLSVLATDAFMEAVEENETLPLWHEKPPRRIEDEHRQTIETMEVDGQTVYVHERVKARDLWNEIMQSTYDYAEPGVIFIDRVNELNNLNLLEHIAATNPCGEQALPPYGACLLGSINLAKLVKDPFTEKAKVDLDELDALVRIAVRMMDNVVDVSNFPLDAQRKEAEAKRRIGLGVTGLADMLCMVRLTYGTEEAAEMTERVLAAIAKSSYMASIELAKEKGPFPLFDPEVFPADGTFLHKFFLQDADIENGIREHGIRNALLTSIAPTGTISLYAGNVSSGIEPIFANSYTRKVLQDDGSKTSEMVEDFAVGAYREFWEDGQGVPHGYPAERFDPDQHLPEYFVTAQELSPEAHIRMQSAAQRWVDNSISKTINLPEDISFQEFKNVYWQAYDGGCKGCTTYRPNEVTGSVLSVAPKEDSEADKDFLSKCADELHRHKVELGTDMTYKMSLEKFGVERAEDVPTEKRREFLEWLAGWGPVLSVERDELPKRPEVLEGKTYKIKVGDQKAVYLTINDEIRADGSRRPFEVFLKSQDPTHDEFMSGLTRTISAVLRRPYDASFIADELRAIHSPISGGFQPGHGYQPSILAAVGAAMKRHMESNRKVAAPEALTAPYGTEEPKEDWMAREGRLAQYGDEEYSIVATKPASVGKSEVRPNLPSCPKCSSYSMKGGVAKGSGLRDDETAVQLGEAKIEEIKPRPGSPCPKCSSYNMKVESGCTTCLDCGHSKCG